MRWFRVQRPPWFADAACRSSQNPAFFPANPTSAAKGAKAICEGCTARIACLTYALDNPELVGIWGGTNDHERRQIRRNVA